MNDYFEKLYEKFNNMTDEEICDMIDKILEDDAQCE